MELRELFEMQRGLDQHIADKHQLEKESLVSRKVLALLVELGELDYEYLPVMKNSISSII